MAKTICLSCLSNNNDEKIDITTTHFENSEYFYVDIFCELLNLETLGNQNLLQYKLMCSNCVEMLNVCYQFIRQSEESLSILRSSIPKVLNVRSEGKFNKFFRLDQMFHSYL